MKPEEVSAILSVAWNKRDPHLHGCELFVGVLPSGSQCFRIDLSSETIYVSDQWRVPMTGPPGTVTRWRIVGQVWSENYTGMTKHEAEFGYRASAEHQLKEYKKIGFDFKMEEFEGQQVARYAKKFLHTKHLYFSEEKGEQHVVDLIEKGSDLLPDMSGNEIDRVGMHPKPEHHEAIDNNEIPRAVQSWTSLLRIGEGVISP